MLEHMLRELHALDARGNDNGRIATNGQDPSVQVCLNTARRRLLLHLALDLLDDPVKVQAVHGDEAFSMLWLATG